MTLIDFGEYARRLASDNNTQFMLPVIEKELLHYEIIHAMEEGGLLSGLVFQGGTCLRLCYGAPRFSEDLDFAGGIHFEASDLHALRDCVSKVLPNRYSIDVKVKEPDEDASLVKKWRIRINTNAQKTGLPVQKISIEVASVPAYTKEPQMLRLNYEGLPATYGDIIVFSESPEEILADKLEAFVCSNHIRYRDLWDIYWLMRRPGINLEKAHRLRKKKETDYDEGNKFDKGLVRINEQLDSIISSREFDAQMKRFITADLHEKTIGREDFCRLLSKDIKELYHRDNF